MLFNKLSIVECLAQITLTSEQYSEISSCIEFKNIRLYAQLLIPMNNNSPSVDKKVPQMEPPFRIKIPV